MNRFGNPYIEQADVNFDAIKKAKEMRQRSKIPRVRTMKKIMKKIKEAKAKQEFTKDVKEAIQTAKADLENVGLKKSDS